MSESKTDIALVERGDNARLIPATLGEAIRIAKFLGATSFIPAGLKEKDGTPKIEEIACAIIMGAEVGLSALQTLQSIDIIPGRRPALNVDAMRSIILGSPLCEYMYDQAITSDSGEILGYQTVIKRKNHPEFIGEFTIDMAKRANLWGKTGPWTQYPRRMLAARSAGFAMREKFGDIIKGLTYASDEVGDMLPSAEEDVSSSTVAPPPERDSLASYIANIAQSLPVSDMELNDLESDILSEEEIIS